MSYDDDPVRRPPNEFADERARAEFEALHAGDPPPAPEDLGHLERVVEEDAAADTEEAAAEVERYDDARNALDKEDERYS